MVTDIENAGLWKFNFPDFVIFIRSVLNRNRNIILEHSYNHRFVFRGLAFQMINVIANPDNRICNHSAIFFIMFVPQLFKMFFFTVRSVEYFIDQRNQKLWHFLSNCSENIIKNGAVIGCFIVGIRVVSCLSFSIYHKRLFLQYEIIRNSSAMTRLWNFNSNCDIWAKCSPWLLRAAFLVTTAWHQIWNIDIYWKQNNAFYD